MKNLNKVFLAVALCLMIGGLATAQNVPIYKEHGGARMVVGSGGSLDVASGGEIDVESGGAFKIGGTAVTSSAAGINSVVSGAAYYALSIAAGGANVAEVTLTAKNLSGSTATGVHSFDVWLSDTATCAGLTNTTASGTVTAKAASGSVIGTYEAKKALRVITLATGVFVLEITDTAKSAFFVCPASPLTGKARAYTQLTTASYGS